MVALCEDSYYVEFFWFPNNGVEDGYWENCWTNDGREEDAIDINESVDDNYQALHPKREERFSLTSVSPGGLHLHV